MVESSQQLSQRLQTAVLALEVFDIDFWVYVLFQDGEEVGQFNPVPEYFGPVDDAEKAACRGDANLLAELFPGLSADAVANYLVTWSPSVYRTQQPQRAYPYDKYTFGDGFQVLDFVHRLGMRLPGGDDGGKTITCLFTCGDP